MFDANDAEFLNFQVFEFIRKNAANIADRTIGEKFLQMADANGRSGRYKNSYKIVPNQFGFKITLDYQGEDNEPLGIWFEEGTKAHFIRPKGSGAQFAKIDPSLTGANVLSWVENGKRFFSAGHFVRGIKKMNIVHGSLEQGMPLFKLELAKQVKEFVENLNGK